MKYHAANIIHPIKVATRSIAVVANKPEEELVLVVAAPEVEVLPADVVTAVPASALDDDDGLDPDGTGPEVPPTGPPWGVTLFSVSSAADLNLANVISVYIPVNIIGQKIIINKKGSWLVH